VSVASGIKEEAVYRIHFIAEYWPPESFSESMGSEKDGIHGKRC